jgi:hypothetical protein
LADLLLHLAQLVRLLCVVLVLHGNSLERAISEAYHLLLQHSLEVCVEGEGNRGFAAVSIGC